MNKMLEIILTLNPFKRVTFCQQVALTLERKQKDLLQAELAALDIPTLKKQCDHLQNWLRINQENTRD